VDMAKNAQAVAADSGLWQGILDDFDLMETAETADGMAGVAAKVGSDAAQGLIESNADKVDLSVSASVGSSFTALFSIIKLIRTLYQGFKD
jgi:hypothetical protein